MSLLGIDLGGTKIEGIVLDSIGNELIRERVKTPSQSYPEIITTIEHLIVSLEEKTQQHNLNIGICTPGAISKKTGLLKNSNTVVLNNKPFLIDLEKQTNRPVKIENDANCFTLSEAVDGAGESANCVFGVIIGTGVGGGIVINQTLLNGPNAITGEWGHNPLPWQNKDELLGNACYCGKTGCIETWLSGVGMALNYQQGNLSSKNIVLKAKSGNKSALDYLDLYAQRLAKSLASIINVLDPDVIVLGGGMSNLDYLYRRVPELWGQYVFSDTVETQLLKAKHSDSSGVRGAAWLWK